MYAVCVTFKIKEGEMNDFMPLMLQNARRSKEAEPGCHQFDVCTDSSRPNEVFLYEIYDDRAAFDAHVQTDHFKIFDAAVGALIAEKSVACYETVQ